MVTDIVFSSEEINLNVDDTETIVAEVLPEDADNKTLEWSSDSPSIVSVTVDEDTHSAVVKGVSEGEAIITAAATDGSGVSAMCNVVVNTPGPKLVTDITLTPNELTLVDTEIGTVTADVLPINADNKVLSWNVDMPWIILSVSEDTHSATVQGEIVDIDGIITVSATDGSGVSATCNVSIEPPPPPFADYRVFSLEQYNVVKSGSNSGLIFKGLEEEDLTLDVVDGNTVNIGKYNGMDNPIDIYFTMDFTQKSEYIIRDELGDVNTYMKLVKIDDGSHPQIWLYYRGHVSECITYQNRLNHNPIKINYRQTYFEDIDNPYKYINYDFNSNNYYVNYGSQIGYHLYGYTVYVTPKVAALFNTAITISDPAGRVEIKKTDINGKNLEITTVKDGITTQDLYAASGDDGYCLLSFRSGGWVYYGPNGSRLYSYEYPYRGATISKTHAWSPT